MALGRKTGGRKAGTPNRRSQELKELLEARFPGWDPVLQLAGVAQDPEVDLSLRVQCAKEVAPYLYARRKSTELSAASGDRITFNMDMTPQALPPPLKRGGKP